MKFKQNREQSYVQTLIVQNEIGHGAFGKVYNLLVNGSDTDFVIKIIRPDKITSALIDELSINATLTKLNNINILTPIRIFKLYTDDDKPSYGILYPRITGTWDDLKVHIRSNPIRQFSLCIQIMLAFFGLHRNLGITHADMSDTNFLILKLNRTVSIKYIIKVPSSADHGNISFILSTDCIANLSDFGSITSLPDNEQEIMEIYLGLNYDFNADKFMYLLPTYYKMISADQHDSFKSDDCLINFIKSLTTMDDTFINDVSSKSFRSIKTDFTCFISNKKVHINDITNCKTISNDCLINAIYSEHTIKYLIK